MQISFFGGAREVGRSAIFLNGEKKFLLDYGIKLNNKTEYPLPLPYVPDAYILSHAHLDHSGYSPFLYTHGTVPLTALHLQ